MFQRNSEKGQSCAESFDNNARYRFSALDVAVAKRMMPIVKDIIITSDSISFFPISQVPLPTDMVGLFEMRRNQQPSPRNKITKITGNAQRACSKISARR